MSNEDNTPTNQQSPIELILEGVNATRNTQLEMYEELKGYRREVQRIRVPVTICIVCAFVCLATTLERLL